VQLIDVPTVSVAEAQVTAVVVLRATSNVYPGLVLGRCKASPEYVAEIVYGPGTDGGV
jgi:hypothetical protein